MRDSMRGRTEHGSRSIGFRSVWFRSHTTKDEPTLKLVILRTFEVFDFDLQINSFAYVRANRRRRVDGFLFFPELGYAAWGGLSIKKLGNSREKGKTKRLSLWQEKTPKYRRRGHLASKRPPTRSEATIVTHGAPCRETNISPFNATRNNNGEKKKRIKDKKTHRLALCLF